MNANSAENLAVSFYNGAKPTDQACTAAAARASWRPPRMRWSVVKNAKTILDTKVKDARATLGFANARARKAAHAV